MVTLNMTTRAAMALLVFLTLIRDPADAGYIPPGPKYRCPEDDLLLHPCKCDSETDQGISVTCQNTNLASMSVGLNNLATFKLPIEKLTIYKCHIARLYGSLLYKLILRILHVEDTPIETIDEHTFLGVNETLNEMYILNSSLTEFPKLAVKNLGNLTVLKIDGHKIPSLPADAFVESDLTGRLLKFHLSNGNLSSLPVESLQALRKLKTLDLHGNQLKDLKRNQFKGLRDTEVLDLSYNRIVKIDSSHIGDLIKLGWCNVSHNGITELTRGAFARNSVLKVLNMSFNKIKRLDSNSFRGMRFLRRLFLSDNLISDVGRGTFGSITRIGTIDLARNFIKNIDYQMFLKLSLAEMIDVSENNVTEIQKLAFKDIYLSTVNLSRNSISKIEDGAFENCANITLDLSHNQIESIPKKAFDETSYAVEFLLSYNLLTEMNQVPLQYMTGLRVLDVSHNQIVNVSKNAFPKLYELHTIDLSHNNLSQIYNSVFQVLFSLRLLDLSYNHLETIKPGTFGALPSLLELDLSYNGLKSVARSAFTRLTTTRKLTLRGNSLDSLFILPISVGHLDLSHNAFKELPPKLWPAMNSLLSLDLSFNQLGDDLVKGSFEGLLTLQKLNLNYNGIRNSPWEALSDFTSLQYLYLEGNNLTKLEKAAFGRLPVVFELNLANNNLHDVSSRAFEGLLQMIVLNLTDNNISVIPNAALQGLVALQSLDLSHNKLEKIDNKTHGLLDDLLSLEHLNLSHNKISFITRKTFPSNPYVPYRLKDIDLSYNPMPVLTYDLAYGTSKVVKLNLSHNGITDIRRYVIGNITSLKILDLSHNKLHNLESDEELFRLPVNVSELYLSNNQLRSLPWKYLKNVTHMEVLDVRNNNFDSFAPELTEMVLAETSVYFEGNPLECNCFVRPLKRYFTGELDLDDFYAAIKCTSPPYLSGRTLSELPEELLNCPSNVNTSRIMESKPGEYDITPDLRIREFRLQDKKFKIKWRITKNEDIADPYIIITDVRDPKKLMYETTLPYFRRSFEIDANLTRRIRMRKMEYRICLLALDSKSSVRNWYKEQCKGMDETVSGAAKTRNYVIYSFMLVMFCTFV